MVTIEKGPRQRLESFVGASLLVLLSVVPVVAQPRIEPDRTISPERVAIVPFVNISGQPDDDWIGVGIAETLAVEFQHRSMFVIIAAEPVAAALRQSQRTDDAPGELPLLAEVGRDLNTRWVLSGGFQRSGDQLRITGRLVDVSNGSIVRASRVDGSVADIFLLQDQLALELVDEAEDRNRMAINPPAQSAIPPSGVAVDPPAQRAIPDGAATTSRAPSSTEPGARARRQPTPEPGVAGLAAPAPGVIDGPPPPVPPEVINRDARGEATIRATRVTEEIRLDGALNEQTYQRVSAITGFVQQAPDEGAPATEKTEAWILFDDDNLYVAGRVWDSAPPSQWVANEMRRDTRQLRQNDTFAVILDTFYDRRNGVAFYTNPLGAIADFAITNEGNPNSDWNPVWDVRTGRFDGGWTVEMEIPFKSLRYRPGPAQVWGIQLRRNVRRKNEWNYITPLPISAGNGQGGIFRVSEAATLVGLDVPSGGRNIEIKPYGIGGVSTNLNAVPLTRNEGNGDVGLDVKYGLTENLTADFTYNTDFAQVEVDEQQVNLTRFSLFFPEKREFFLEGRGIFGFARGAFASGFGGALRTQGGGGFFGGGNAPTIFYSRQIGLQNGAVVPILGGGRVTGKIGPFDVGAVNIQTDDEMISGAEMTNFTVVRLKRDILRRSSIGAILTNRSVSLSGEGSSQAYGVDTTFSFYENISFLGYLAKTETPGVSSKNTSYQGRFNYAGDRYGFQTEHLLVEDNFRPEVGFIRRDNFRRTYTTARFSPRPRSIDAIRQFRLEGAVDYIVTADTGQLETRQSQVGFSTELENSDRIGISVAENYEFLIEEFKPGPGVVLPVGGYSFQDVEATYALGAQHRVVGTVSAQVGQYFNGTIKTVGFRQGRVEVTERLSVEPGLSFNWIDTPQGSFRTDLVVSRVNFSFTPRMFFSGLVQYNSASSTVSSNFRLRWEYSPGSELFVVYTEGRDTDPLRPDRFTELQNRGFVVKMNRLFRF